VEQRPADCPTGGDEHRISVTIANGHDSTSLNELSTANDGRQVHGEIDFKGGFG
jgi:hypothetical protein